MSLLSPAAPRGGGSRGRFPVRYRHLAGGRPPRSRARQPPRRRERRRLVTPSRWPPGRSSAMAAAQENTGRLLIMVSDARKSTRGHLDAAVREAGEVAEKLIGSVLY